jgi:uncharacterized protein (DUF983 family)
MVGAWGRFSPHCPACGHRFEREEGYWLGAVLLNTVAAVGVFAVTLVALMVATWPEVPWGVVTAVVVPVSVVVPIVFYPWAKALWVALDLTIRPPEAGEREAAERRLAS